MKEPPSVDKALKLSFCLLLHFSDKFVILSEKE